MSIAAGAFLFLFGAFGVWLILTRYPKAHFMRTGYVFMSLGGLISVMWGLTHTLVLGVAGMVLLLVGGASGVLGALRKELRMLPPA